MNGYFKDTRLIEAFDQIDPKYIAEVGESLKLRSVYTKEGEQPKNKLRINIKQITALAACVLLLSLVIPLFGYVGNLIADFAAGHAGTPEDFPYLVYSLDVEPLSQEMMDEFNEALIPFYLEMTKEELIAEYGENYVEELDQLWLFGYRESSCTAYYGTFGDCIVVASVNSDYGDSEIIIAGYKVIKHTFVYHYPTKTMYWIDDAYAMGVLDNDDIELINERHKKCMQYEREGTITEVAKEQTYDNIYILTEEDLAELNEAYFKYNFQYELNNNIYTEEQIEQIRNSKYGKFAETVEEAMQRGTYANSRFYFGKFGDSIVVALSGMASMGQRFELDRYRFRFPNSTVYVCHDSTFYLPTEAYELGYLNFSDVKILYDMYIEYFARIPDELKIAPQSVYQGAYLLSYEESREIIWEYMKYDEDPNRLDYVYNVKCYGKFGDAYAVMIGSNAMKFKDEERIESVAGIDFKFETEQKMYIYYWGRFDSIDLAYDLEWIDMDDLLKLKERWNRRVAD